MDKDAELTSLSESEVKAMILDQETVINNVVSWMNSIQHNDLNSMKVVNNHINRHCFDDEIKMMNALTASAERGNYFSMLQLARYFKNPDNSHESDPEYFFWLQKIAEDELIKKYIDSLKKNTKLEDVDSESQVYLQLVAGSVYYELGLYYRNSEKKEELKKALAYINNAEICGYPSYPGPHVTHEIKVELINRLERLEKYERNLRIEHSQIELFRDISIDNLDVNDQIIELKKRLINEIGEKTWNDSRDETRTCLITAVSCFYYLLHTTNDSIKLDYSCIILPLMKSLEHELRIRFYNGYIDYLKAHFQKTDLFFNENGISSNGKNSLRGGVLYKNKWGNYYFSDYNKYPNSYTLGSFQYSLGIEDLDQIGNHTPITDATMIRYCRECLLRDSIYSDKEIDTWLYTLAVDIDRFKDTRNLSAHGGNIKDSFSAEEALNDLILIERILLKLIQKCK